jgi:hypothetical protein
MLMCWDSIIFHLAESLTLGELRPLRNPNEPSEIEQEG